MHEALPHGSLIRKLWIGEAEIYRDHLLRLDAESRRNRFAGLVSDEFVHGYADLSFGIDAVIHGFFVDGTLRGAAELRPIGLPITHEAEAAFSIEKPWQSHGIGSVLLERTLLAARNRGLKFLHMACLADNKRMQQLARKYEAELSFDFSQRRRRGRDAAADAGLADARNSRRRSRLRHRHVRCAEPPVAAGVSVDGSRRMGGAYEGAGALIAIPIATAVLVER